MFLHLIGPDHFCVTRRYDTTVSNWRSWDDTTLPSLFSSSSTSMCLSAPPGGHHTARWRRPDVLWGRVEGRAAGVDKVLSDVSDPGGLRHSGGRAQTPVEVVVELGVWGRTGAGTTAIIIPVGTRHLRVSRHNLHSTTHSLSTVSLVSLVQSAGTLYRWLFEVIWPFF